MPDNNDETKTMLRNFYDQNALDRNNTEQEEWKKPPKENFLSLVHSEGKKTLLELGAGPGKDSMYFKENGLDVTAVDLSGEMVKLCKEKGIDAYEMDFYSLTGLNKTFDSIWSMNSLLHVGKTELPHVLTEIDKVLNPSGLFFMGVYGGEDSEIIISDDRYNLPRFFSRFADESLHKLLVKYFDIVNFEIICFDEAADSKVWNFQAVTMRKITCSS